MLSLIQQLRETMFVKSINLDTWETMCIRFNWSFLLGWKTLFCIII